MVGSFRYSLSPSTFFRVSFLLVPKIQLGWRFDSFLLHHRYRYFIGAPETAKLHCNQSIFWSECTVQFHYSLFSARESFFPYLHFSCILHIALYSEVSWHFGMNDGCCCQQWCCWSCRCCCCCSYRFFGQSWLCTFYDSINELYTFTAFIDYYRIRSHKC